VTSPKKGYNAVNGVDKLQTTQTMRLTTHFKRLHTSGPTSPFLHTHTHRPRARRLEALSRRRPLARHTATPPSMLPPRDQSASAHSIAAPIETQ